MNDERRLEALVDYKDWLVEMAKAELDPDDLPDGLEECNNGAIADVNQCIVLETIQALMDNGKDLMEYIELVVETRFDSLVESGMNIDFEWLEQECRTNWLETVNAQGMSQALKWERDGELSAYSTYLGSTFNIVPSGKYYTPFACSNVNMAEAMADAIWYDAMTEVLDARGFYLASGVGDPTDIHIVGTNKDYLAMENHFCG